MAAGPWQPVVGDWIEEVKAKKSRCAGGVTGVVLGSPAKNVSSVLVVSVWHLSLMPPQLKIYQRVALKNKSLRPFKGTKACSGDELDSRFAEALQMLTKSEEGEAEDDEEHALPQEDFEACQAEQPYTTVDVVSKDVLVASDMAAGAVASIEDSAQVDEASKAAEEGRVATDIVAAAEVEHERRAVVGDEEEDAESAAAAAVPIETYERTAVVEHEIPAALEKNSAETCEGSDVVSLASVPPAQSPLVVDVPPTVTPPTAETAQTVISPATGVAQHAIMMSSNTSTAPVLRRVVQVGPKRAQRNSSLLYVLESPATPDPKRRRVELDAGPNIETPQSHAPRPPRRNAAASNIEVREPDAVSGHGTFMKGTLSEVLKGHVEVQWFQGARARSISADTGRGRKSTKGMEMLMASDGCCAEMLTRGLLTNVSCKRDNITRIHDKYVQEGKATLVVRSHMDGAEGETVMYVCLSRMNPGRLAQILADLRR